MKWHPQNYPHPPADVVIDTEGTVWVTTTPANTYGNWIEELEVFNAEGYDPTRNSGDRPGRRSGRPSQWRSDGYTWGRSSFDEDFEFDQKPDPIAEGVAAHERLEDLFNGSAGYKFKRDPLTPEALEQIRLYAMQYPGRDDGIRHWPV